MSDQITKRILERSKLKLGSVVTATQPIKADYSGYAGRPFQNFEPGMIGVVGDFHGGKGWNWIYVYFLGKDHPRPEINGNQWRVVITRDYMLDWIKIVDAPAPKGVDIITKRH